MRASALLLLMILAIPPLAAGEPAVASAEDLAFFESRIRPVLVEHCYECHSAGAKKVKAKLFLDTREGLLRGGEGGPAIVPGDPERSLLVKAMRYADQDLEMPPEQALPAAVIADFEAWVRRGAPDPRQADPAAPPVQHGIDLAAARRHWAYLPLSDPPPPAVTDPAWVASPYDAFIHAGLGAAGLRPSPPASRERFIRRVSFDLVGLPPTPDEVAAFIADPGADAEARLVDRLLASPHFGERWARHWLDLARFAESHGFEHDYDRPTAYHYRDFVIQAFNRDLPYDTFIKWQLAGDEFAPDDTLALKATGFVAAGVWPTQITKNEVEKARYDALDDMLSTTFSAALATTIGCARCHDHKYDPIAQKDYYRLLSTFTTTVRSDVERDVSPPGLAREQAAFAAEHAPYEAALRAYEHERLPSSLAAAGEALAGGWMLIDGEVRSAGGASHQRRDDGSFLASGANPEHDTYTVTAAAPVGGITAIRVEALTDPSLPKGGPGRAENGNFALTGLTVRLAPADGVEGEGDSEAFGDAEATFSQAGLPVTAAIDRDPISGWAVDGQIGRDHAAVFRFARPLDADRGSRLTITLRFANNRGHGIGRLRLAVTAAAAPPALLDAPLTAGLLAILRMDPAGRTAAQQAALLDWYRPMDAEWKRLRGEADAHLAKAPKPTLAKVLVASEGLAAIRLHTQGADFLPETHFLRRGDPDQKVEPVSQSFWPVLMDGPETRWQEAPPDGWRTSYRRRALANWLVDTRHGAGALLARVAVNRLWQHLLGRGIVATPSDFGLRGDPPSHPQLLDRLATDLVRGGWRLKPLIRSIALSSAYRQASTRDPAVLAADHDNRWFGRFNRRRLEAEAIRDGLLAISGQLDPTMHGPGTLDPASRRRSIYHTIKRSALPSMMTVFDLPDPIQSVSERPTTTIAPQALMLLNNPQVRAWAEGLAGRLARAGGPALAVRDGYRIALGRAPDGDELAAGIAFLTAPGANDRALVDFAQVLMCLNDVIYID